MKRICIFSIILLLSKFAYGCSEDVKENRVDFDLIASERTSPSDYDFDDLKIEKSSNQLEFGKTWTMYRLEEKFPNVNFNEKDVYFICVNGSSSCPYTIERIIRSKDKRDLIVSLSSPDGDCTTDLAPRTIVIQIDKNTSEEINNLKIVK